MHGNIIASRARRNPIGGLLYVLINRNLMNYPWARDQHLRIEWKKYKRQYQYADLPGEERVELRFPLDAKPRCPTVFDMTFLFRLMSVAKTRHKPEIKFASMAELLRYAGCTINSYNRRKAESALALWSTLSVWTDVWHYAEQGKDGRLMTPAVRFSRMGTQGIRIELNEKWWRAWRSYYMEVPLPLPVYAPTLNLLLLCLTMKRGNVEGDVEVDKFKASSSARNLIKLRKQCGILHHNASERMEDAMREVKTYYKRHGGKIEFAHGRRDLVWIMVWKQIRT